MNLKEICSSKKVIKTSCIGITNSDVFSLPMVTTAAKIYHNPSGQNLNCDTSVPSLRDCVKHTGGFFDGFLFIYKTIESGDKCCQFFRNCNELL